MDDEGGGGVGDEDGATSAQYLNRNCVLVTYYTGEISQVVDEHFTRALNAGEKANGEIFYILKNLFYWQK